MTNNTESREVDWSWLWENLKEWRTHNKGGTENLVTVSDSLLGKLSLALRKGQSQSSQIQDLKDEIERLRKLITVLIENDPNDDVCDGGHTVLDLWRHDARNALSNKEG